jgi:hypothetical protein
MATYGLDIVATGAPELPEGVDRDPVRRQEDFSETADVFGYVTVRLSLHPDDAGSSLSVAKWFKEHLRCDELAIGEIRFEDDSTYVSLHSSKIGTAMKAIEKRTYNDQTMTAVIVE